MIWLLRHGDAENEGPDDERALTERGRRESRNVGAALAALGVSIDACLASPKRRARETAELACEALGVEVEIAQELAGGSFDAQRLAAGRGEVLLVGHDPDVSGAVHDLTGAAVSMKKGMLAGIEGRELRSLLRPEQLETLATS